MKPQNHKEKARKEKTAIVLSSGKALNESKFCRYFERKVAKTIKRFNMFGNKDKIAVACSGGKDSITVLYMLNKICRKRNQPVEAIVVEEGIGNYRKNLINKLQAFCKKEKIKLHILSFKKEYGFNLFQIAPKIKKMKLSNCYVCSVLKRWMMNKFAKQKGFTVIATGHNLDDEAETIILNQMKGSPALLAKLGPVSGIMKREDFVQRIKPLYFCPEKEIILYAKLKNLPLSFEICPARGETFRVEIRNFLREMDKKHVEVKNAIVNSFLQIMPMLKEKYFGQRQLKKCRVCKQPCSQDVCKRCQLLKLLKNKKGN